MDRDWTVLSDVALLEAWIFKWTKEEYEQIHTELVNRGMIKPADFEDDD